MIVASNAIHGLEVSAGTSVRAETWFNGILVARKEIGETGVDSIPIQHDMLPGQNVAEVRVGLAGMNLEQPPAPIPGTPPVTAHARLLLQMDEPREVGDTLEVTSRDMDQVVWAPGQDDVPAPTSLPHRLRLTFAPLTPIIIPPWAEATPQTADNLAETVYARMVELATMLRDGDDDAYDDLTALRREHMARSYPLGQSAEAARVHDREEFAAIRAEPGFTVTLLPRNQARFRAMAGGRLIDCTDAHGDSALTISSDSLPSSPIGAQFSLLGGSLVITR